MAGSVGSHDYLQIILSWPIIQDCIAMINPRLTGGANEMRGAAKRQRIFARLPAGKSLHCTASACGKHVRVI
jgi:hypothetical protein